MFCRTVYIRHDLCNIVHQCPPCAVVNAVVVVVVVVVLTVVLPICPT